MHAIKKINFEFSYLFVQNEISGRSNNKFKILKTNETSLKESIQRKLKKSNQKKVTKENFSLINNLFSNINFYPYTIYKVDYIKINSIIHFLRVS